MNKILITGAAGFVGSALARFLIKRNYDVTLIDNYYIPSNITDVENIPIQRLDVRNPLLDVSSYNYVFHLAAVSGIRRCEENKAEAFDINVKGTFNILKTLKGRIIFASTSAIYGQAEEPVIQEESTVKPRNYYGATKLYGEKLISLTDNYCILRFSNIYGKALLCKRTVTDLFIENVIKGLPITIHGDGKQKRDFIHINDTIRSYWYAMNSELNDTFNIGGNEELTVNDIAKIVCDNYRMVFQYTPEIKMVPVEGGTMWKDFVYSIDKAKERLKYTPSHEMVDEIRRRLNAHSRTVQRRKPGTSV